MTDRSATEQRFYPNKVNDDQADRITTLREAFADMALTVELELPPSRERALVMTKLEEGAMWATKAVTHGPEA